MSELNRIEQLAGRPFPRVPKEAESYLYSDDVEMALVKKQQRKDRVQWSGEVVAGLGWVVMDKLFGRTLERVQSALDSHDPYGYDGSRLRIEPEASDER